jgi:hypothetical protein
MLSPSVLPSGFFSYWLDTLFLPLHCGPD